MLSISDMVRYVLVTQERCIHCMRVCQDFLPKHGDQLSSIAPFDRIHLKQAEDMNKLPREIKSHVKVAPQLYAIYNDGTFANINPLEIKHFSTWLGETMEQAEKKAGSKLVLMVLLADGNQNCSKWKESGDLDKFIEEEKEKHGDKLHIDQFVLDRPDKTEKEGSQKFLLKQAFIKFRVPYLIALPYKVWKEPTIENIQKNFYPCVQDPRNEEGRKVVDRWLEELMSDEGLLFYLLLSTSDGCPHCINWKSSGGEATFKSKFSNISGVLLVHNGMIPGSVQGKIPYVPSLMLVSRDEWTKPDPSVIQGPDPRDIKKVEEWLDDQMKNTRWRNSKKTSPEDFPKEKKKSGPRRQRL